MENRTETPTSANGTVMDSKDKKDGEKKMLNAEEIFEELGGPVGGWTNWHIFMFNVLCIFGITYIGLHSPAIVFLGKSVFPR